MQQQASMATAGAAGALPPVLGGRAGDEGAAQVFLTLTVADTLCGVPVPRLGLPPRATETAGMSVVVERDGELYSLLVDEVGDVVPLPRSGRAAKPPTLDPLWREVATDVHRLEDRLVILLDVERVLAIGA